MVRPRGAPFLEHGDAVHLRQADIEDDGVIGFGVAEKMAFLAVIGLIDDIARFFQRFGQLPVEIPSSSTTRMRIVSASSTSGCHAPTPQYNRQVEAGLPATSDTVTVTLRGRSCRRPGTSTVTRQLPAALRLRRRKAAGRRSRATTCWAAALQSPAAQLNDADWQGEVAASASAMTAAASARRQVRGHDQGGYHRLIILRHCCKLM